MEQQQPFGFHEAMQRAKALSTNPQNNNSLKRSLSNDVNIVPSKKFNSDSSVIKKETIEVPQPAIGLVIGKGGEQVRNIMGLSGADVQVGQEGDKPGYRQIHLTGNENQIDHARLLITNLVTSKTLGGIGHDRRSSLGGNSNGPGNEVISKTIAIPPSKCGLLIGKNGESIRSLQERFDVKMQLIQDTKMVTGPKPLEITGYPDKVDNAIRFIQENYCQHESPRGYHYMERPSGDGPKCILQVLVPKDSVGLIIGKGGEQIKKISYESGAKIQFDNDEGDNPNEKRAIVQGTKEQVNRAAALMAEMIESQIYYMHVPANKAGRVIGRSGEVIQQISADSGARVQISKQQPAHYNERVFEIKGKPMNIQKAIHLIKIEVGEIPTGTPFHYAGPCAGTPGIPMVPNYATPTISLGGVTSGSIGVGTNQNIYNQSQPAQLAIVQTSPQQPGYTPTPIVIPNQPVHMPQGQIVGASQPVQNQAPDYSTQWIEYYRKMGLNDKAAEVEKFVMEKNKISGASMQLQSSPNQNPIVREIQPNQVAQPHPGYPTQAYI